MQALTAIVILLCFIGICACMLFQGNKGEQDLRLPANIKELWITKLIRSCKTFEQLEVCESLVNTFESEYIDTHDISTRITRLQMELQYQRVFKIQVFNHVN